MLDQRRRRWYDIVQMLYKCSVFAGMLVITVTIIKRCFSSPYCHAHMPIAELTGPISIIGSHEK